MTLREESGTGPPAGPPGSSAEPGRPRRRQRARAALLIGGLAVIALTRTAREPRMTLPEESGTGPPARPLDPRAARPGRPARRRRTRAALLIGGLAAAALIGLGSLAAVLLPHGRAHATPAALPSVFGLRAGECVNSGPGGVSTPTVVPCAQAHDAEVYARFTLAGARWPGTAGLGGLARRGCTARLGGYLNPQLATAVLAEFYVFPDRGAWNAGERTVICEIRGTAGQLTGSVRGLG